MKNNIYITSQINVFIQFSNYSTILQSCQQEILEPIGSISWVSNGRRVNGLNSAPYKSVIVSLGTTLDPRLLLNGWAAPFMAAAIHPIGVWTCDWTLEKCYIYISAAHLPLTINTQTTSHIFKQGYLWVHTLNLQHFWRKSVRIK